MRLDEKAYVERGGNVCPYCESKLIEGQGNVEVDEYGATMEVVCYDCDQRWYDVFTLTGYMPLED